MYMLSSERACDFCERHQLIDWLRGRRESRDSLAVDPESVYALLQEIDLLQVVAQAAKQVAAFPCGESADEPLAHLRTSLRRWEE